MRAKHIVVIDDDADVLDVIERLLENAGYRVTGFANATTMRTAAALGGAIDLLVLDGTLRGETRAAVTEFVKSARLPVVMISGDPHSMKTAAEQRLQLLWKPFSGAELCKAVETALASGEVGRRVEDPA